MILNWGRPLYSQPFKTIVLNPENLSLRPWSKTRFLIEIIKFCNGVIPSFPSIFKNNNKIIKNDKAEVLNIISFILKSFYGKISEK